MIVVIGGFCIGAVVGGIVWAVDRYKRQDRYKKEREEQETIIQAKNTIVTQLKDTKVDLTAQVERNKTVVQQFKTNAADLKLRRDQSRSETEKLKESR
ncbi:MAG: hypothetical protein M3R00_10635, partial [Pseudomonadota bacterium]|nr:hypothetical protein [Pseudomonadota bacterium]